MSYEPVEVFDLGPSGGTAPTHRAADGVAARGSDAGVAGRGPDPGVTRRGLDPRLTRRGPDPGMTRRGLDPGVPVAVAGIAAVAALIALIVAVGVWRHRTRTVTTVRTVAAGAPVAVDAAGCPLTDRCRVATGSPMLYAAVLTWDPAATLVTGIDVRSAVGVPLRATLVADTEVTFPNGSPLERARSVLTIVSQCVPGGAAVVSSVGADAARRVQTVTVAGRPGCSVTVTSEAEDGVPVPIESLADLARRPGMQL